MTPNILNVCPRCHSPEINIDHKSGNAGCQTCISGDAYIHYNVRRPKDGKVQSCKGGSLWQLYHRFHGLKTVRIQCVNRRTKDSWFAVQSVDDRGGIFLNRVVDVIDKGDRDVHRIVTESGYSLKLTLDHEIMSEGGYRRLQDISTGDRICVHPGRKIPTGGRGEPQIYRKEVYVKYHPTASSRVINGCRYYRLRVYRAVFEAARNNLAYEDYILALNMWPKGRIDRFWVIPSDLEVHHKDRDIQNNTLSNLELVTVLDHKRLHEDAAVKAQRILVQLDKVVAISPVGQERVFDIRCSDPHRNFVADGIVVHNCGKAVRVYELMLFFPNEEEHKFLRNPMREMAGHCAELSGTSLVKALDAVLTRFGVRMNLDVKRQVLSHVVAGAFKDLYYQTFTFLPEVTKNQVSLVSELIQKYTEGIDGIGGQAGEPAQSAGEGGECAGEAGQEPGVGSGADAGDAGGASEAGTGPGAEEAGVPVSEGGTP